MQPKYYSFDSPIGRLTIYFIEGHVIGLSFMEEGKDYKHIERYYGEPIEVDEKDYNYHDEIIRYLEGDLKKFTIPIIIKGTEFQEKVWKELLNVGYGQSITYGELAKNIGNPKASRAIGGAMNKNPIAIIVP